jgi:hypothetical protein
VNLRFELASGPASPRGFFSSVRVTSNTSLPFLLRQPIIDFSASSCGRVLSSPIELGYSGLTVGLVGVVDVQGPFVSAEAGPNLILDPFMGHGVGILQPRHRMDMRLDASGLGWVIEAVRHGAELARPGPAAAFPAGNACSIYATVADKISILQDKTAKAATSPRLNVVSATASRCKSSAMGALTFFGSRPR